MIVAMLQEIQTELERSRGMSPNPSGCLAALVEVVGTLAKALLDEPRDRVREEAVQLAALAIRVGEEGDPALDTVRLARTFEREAVQRSHRTYLDMPEAVSYTGMSRRTLDYAKDAGELPFIKKGKKVVFARDDLDTWMLRDRVAV
jgi:excisionase family DNA binding protein